MNRKNKGQKCGCKQAINSQYCLRHSKKTNIKENTMKKSDIKEIIREAIMEMAFNEYPMQYYVTDSYVNVHRNGAQASEHNHACNSIVVAAYLNMPENGGYFQAKDPLEYHKTNLPISSENMWSTIPTKSNDVLVFPSWLQHRTQPNLSNEDRWVLTTNFSHKF